MTLPYFSLDAHEHSNRVFTVSLIHRMSVHELNLHFVSRRGEKLRMGPSWTKKGEVALY